MAAGLLAKGHIHDPVGGVIDEHHDALCIRGNDAFRYRSEDVLMVDIHDVAGLRGANGDQVSR